MKLEPSITGYTLIELLAILAIITVLVASLVVFIPDFISWAHQTSDKQTLTVLNDTLTRYKTEGGDIVSLTTGVPTGNVLGRMQKTITWGGIGHQVMRSGITYRASSISVLGALAQYRFTRYNTYTSEVGGITNPNINTPGGGLSTSWGFDEGTGTTTADSSSAQSGSLVGNPGWVAGHNGGYALNFNGSNYVQVASGGGVNFSSSQGFSMFCWVNSTDVSGPTNCRLFGINLMAPASYIWVNFGFGFPWLDTVDSNGHSAYIPSQATFVADGSWHHVGFVADRSASKISLFIDGRFIRSLSLGGWTGGYLNPNGAPLYIGSEGGSNGFVGVIDNVRVYNRALSNAEVAELYGQ